MQELRLIDANKVLDIVMAYCPDDDGSCSKAGVDLREMLDEIEALPEIDELSEAWRCNDKKLNDAIDCIHDFCKARKGKCIDCPAYITFRIESGDTVQTCKFRCDAPVNWEHLEIGGKDNA